MEDVCRNIREQIPELVTGALPPERAARLRQHISQCQACSEYLRALQADDKLLGDFAEAMQPAVTRLEDNVTEELNREQLSESVSFASIWRTIAKRPATKLAAAAVIIVAALIGVKIFTGRVEPERPQIVVEHVRPEVEAPREDVVTRMRESAVVASKVELETELAMVRKMIAAGDIDGLAVVLEQGSLESRIVAANYLAKIGDSRGITALEELRAAYVGSEPNTMLSMGSVAERLADANVSCVPVLEKIEGRKGEEAQELDGREVAVRLYKDWRNDSAAFEKATAMVFGQTVKLAFDDVDDSAVVAVFGQDQQDELLKELIGSRVYGWGYAKGLEFTLPENKRTKQEGYCFVDALGNSLPNATVEVYLRTRRPDGKIHLGRMKADDRGYLKLSFCLGKATARAGIGRVSWWYDSGRFFFEILHPDYKGVAVVEPYSYGHSGQSPTTVYVPLVSPGSEADKRSIWGMVVGPNKKPVSGIVVEGRTLLPPGGEWVGRVRHQSCAVLTDRQGRFRLYLPTREDREHIGRLVPPKSEYYVKVEPPRELGFAPFDGKITNGQETIITLERAGRFRTFVFEDENGPINDPRRLRTIDVDIERHGQRDLGLGYYDWKDGGMFPLGTYRAMTITSGGERNYDSVPLEVTHDSPEQLVFRLPPGDKTYYGRVVNGITGEPMQGAFVMEPGGVGDDKNLSMLSRAQWDALHKLPASVSAGDKGYRQVLKQLDNAFYSDHPRLVRTNKDGWFEMKMPAKVRVGRLAIFEQDYFSVIIESSKLKQNTDGNFEIPTVKMFPAAKVKVQFGCEGAKDDNCPRVCPEWIIDTNNNPAWAKDLVAGCSADHRNDIRIHNDFYLYPKYRQSFYVPAGLNLDLQLRMRGWEKEEGWAPITIAENIKLQQGEVLDLGWQEIHRAIKVFAEVLNSVGEPVEGLPVGVLSQYGSTTHNTDEYGLAWFDVAPDARGEFVVEYNKDGDPNEPHLREAIPCEIAGPEDANNVYTLQISDELLYQLFK